MCTPPIKVEKLGVVWERRKLNHINEDTWTIDEYIIYAWTIVYGDIVRANEISFRLRLNIAYCVDFTESS